MSCPVGAVTDRHADTNLSRLVTRIDYKHDWTYKSLQGRVRVVYKILVVSHLTGLEKKEQCASAKLEVAQLLGTLDMVALLTRDDSAANHHGTNANDHNTAVCNGVDGYYDAHVLAIYVQS